MLKITNEEIKALFANVINPLELSNAINQVTRTANFLLQALIVEFCCAGRKSKNITLPIEKYMRHRGLRDKEAAIEQINRDLDILHRYIITYQNEKVKSKKKCDQNFFDISLCQGKGIDGQHIVFYLSDFFYEYLSGAYIMPVHPDAFTLNHIKNEAKND